MATDQGNAWGARLLLDAEHHLADASNSLDRASRKDADALLHGAAKVALAKVEEARSILATALADMGRITGKKQDL